MRVLTPGTALGVGLGGFADGVLLHQIAQVAHGRGRRPWVVSGA